jgi:hypothetical protein
MKIDNIYTRPIYPLIGDMVEVVWLNNDEEKELVTAEVVNVDHFAVVDGEVVDPSNDNVRQSIVVVTAIDNDKNPHSNIGTVDELSNKIKWSSEWFGDRIVEGSK